MIAAQPPTADRLAVLARAVEAELRDNILPFWLGLRDTARGGFFGAAASDGTAVPSAPKGAVLHARILWALSAAAMRFSDPALLDAAEFAYRFIAKHLVDPVSGGVIWTVSAEGGPANRHKYIYAQAFAIYGLAAFHRASGDLEALDLAQQLWRAVERHAVDTERAGYFESFSPDWQIAPNKLMGPTPIPKTFNTHFHLFEAYGALLEVWPDPALGKRLEQLAMLLTEKLLDQERNTFRQLYEADWRTLDDGQSYGHDIQASWVIPAVAHQLAPERADRVRRSVAGIPDAVLQRAVDVDGGVATGRGPDGRPADGKVWWVQAEALVGFLDAFERRREMRFLEAAEGVWGFIQRSIVDRTGGEWRSWIAPAGVPQPDLPKADLWKCPYHNTRACLEMMDRAGRLALQMPVS